MPINDYKAITIPEGSVKKIEDANGNIIWGSQADFPYRRLEYLHFNGTDNYMWAQLTTKAGFNRSIICSLDRKDVRQVILGAYEGNLSDNTRRGFYLADIRPDSNGTRSYLGSTWSSSFDTANIPLDTKMSVWATNTYTNNQNHMYWGITNYNTGQSIIPQITVNGSSTTLTASQPYILGLRSISSSGVSSLVAPTQGKLYRFVERSGNASGTITRNCFPVQRKSDNKYGLYDITNSLFITLQGTADSSTAGPVVDEYWDLTDPD